jgi:hypothetical protein
MATHGKDYVRSLLRRMTKRSADSDLVAAWSPGLPAAAEPHFSKAEAAFLLPLSLLR